MAIQQQCFDNVQFNRFLENQSDAKEEARIVAHIATCEQCQGVLERLAGQPEVWTDIQRHLAQNDARPAPRTEGDFESQDVDRDLQNLRELLGRTDDPSMIGRLAGYEVCGLIGRGSAGLVVKALDTRLNRYVAIKLLAPVYSNNGSARRRFEREGRAIASVKDPNVIPVYSVGEYQGTPYIVMQYVPEGSLQQRIDKQGPLTTSEVACVGMQIARGLTAAHQRGVVHRDVKPANVLLESGVDCAMVTDFGLARVLDEATMTRSGGISGTPQYMSPEQAQGETVDPRTDLFSLGSVMYAACTGRSPFRAESVFGVIKRVCDSEPTPIREINPDIAEWLVAFIEKLHAKRREDRFDSAEEVARILSEELAHLQAPTMVPEPRRDWWQRDRAVSPKTSRNLKLGIGAVLATTIAVSAAWGLTTFLGESGAGNKNVAGNNTGSSMPMTPQGLLALTLEQNEKMPRFQNSVKTTIDVETGGRLFLRSNLGSVNVRTHNKPTVEMTLVHTVAAKDKETAAAIHRALKMAYDFDAKETAKAKPEKGRDAVIIARFPTRKLSEEEVMAAESLKELQEQFRIRNNSHHSNAKFELRIPRRFHIDVVSAAGPIRTANIDGWARIVSHGGKIEAGHVTEKAHLESHGGHIVLGNCASAKVMSHGGHVEVGNVKGDLVAASHGGHVRARAVSGVMTVESHGGSIIVEHAMAAAKATSHGGHVTIWKAAGPVNAVAGAGAIEVNFLDQPQGNSVLKSDVGAVRVGYADGLNFNIEASTKLGHVSAPFMEKGRKQLTHQLNKGGDQIRATTNVGSVHFAVVTPEEIDEQIAKEREMGTAKAAFNRAYDLHMEGHLDEAIKAHKHAATFAEYKGVATYNLGCAWALKGNKDKAFAALNEAIASGFDDAEQFEDDDDLDSLRDDERFDKLMSKLKKSDDCGSVREARDEVEVSCSGHCKIR